MRRRRALALCALAVAVPATGCSDRGTRTSGGDEARLEAFEGALEREGLVVHGLALEGGVVELTYSPGEVATGDGDGDGDGDEEGAATTEARVEASVDAVARAFFDRVYGGWEVDELRAEATVDGNTLVTWRVEAEWISAYLDGDLTRAELAERIGATVERHD